MTLKNKKCVPCSGDAIALNVEQANDLLKQLNEWQLIDNASWLKKDFKFKNFVETLDFVNKVGEIAEEENHHPDIYFTWGKCSIQIQTHKIEGLHESDFILAAKIDSI